MSDLLEIANVSKRFGGLVAVSKVSFTVQEREILSVIATRFYGRASRERL